MLTHVKIPTFVQMKFNPLALIVNITIPIAIGAVGAWFTLQGVKIWYSCVLFL